MSDRLAFKVDENLPREIVDLLRDCGWDACGVPDQRLSGAPDPRIVARPDRHSAAACATSS